MRIERERSVLGAGDAHGARGAAGAGERDVVELDRVSVAQLQREGARRACAGAGTRAIAATEEHTASVAVIFRA